MTFDARPVSKLEALSIGAEAVPEQR